MTQLDFFAPHVQTGRSILPRDTNGHALPTEAEARAKAERGMRQAIENAGSEWAEIAYDYLVAFCRQRKPVPFISEDVSDLSIAFGLPQPPTLKAWGAVYRRAIKAGLIEQCGSGRSRRRHASICPMWRAI